MWAARRAPALLTEQTQEAGPINQLPEGPAPAPPWNLVVPLEKAGGQGVQAPPQRAPEPLRAHSFPEKATHSASGMVWGLGCLSWAQRIRAEAAPMAAS